MFIKKLNLINVLNYYLIKKPIYDKLLSYKEIHNSLNICLKEKFLKIKLLLLITFIIYIYIKFSKNFQISIYLR